MAEFDIHFGDDAVQRALTLNHEAVISHDPDWAAFVVNGDLMLAFREDRAALLTHEDGSWAVLEPVIDEDDAAVLFVHAAYCASHETFVKGAEWLEKAAAKHPRCKGLRFGSHRKGWTRAARRLGYAHEGDGYYWKAAA